MAKRKKNALGKVRYRQNREKILERQNKYNAEHREQRREYARQWYLKNREKRKEQIKKYRSDPIVAEHLKRCAEIYRLANQDRRNELQRANYAKDPERHRGYARKWLSKPGNLEKHRESVMKSKYKEKGLTVETVGNMRFILPLETTEKGNSGGNGD